MSRLPARTLRVTKPHLMHGHDVMLLQEGLNDRLVAPGGMDPVKSDGTYGHSTNRAYLHVGWDLGFDIVSLRRGATVWGQRKLEHHWPVTPGEHERARKRHGHPNPFLEANLLPVHGLVLLDGKWCAAWIAADVLKVRAAGRWHGVVVSGHRDPIYSEHLCFQMCGAPTCRGRCAGRRTNHVGIEEPAGAVDVTDYIVFGQECYRLGLNLRNNLPSDRAHFSRTGY